MKCTTVALFSAVNALTKVQTTFTVAGVQVPVIEAYEDSATMSSYTKVIVYLHSGDGDGE